MMSRGFSTMPWVDFCVTTPNVFNFSVQPCLMCAHCFEYSVYFLSLCISETSSSIPYSNIILDFHQLLPHTGKHFLTSCMRLTPVSYGSWSPTDMSVTQSWLSGVGLRGFPRVTKPDQTRVTHLGESLAHQMSTGKKEMTASHLFSTLVSCLHVSCVMALLPSRACCVCLLLRCWWVSLFVCRSAAQMWSTWPVFQLRSGYSALNPLSTTQHHVFSWYVSAISLD